MKKIAIIGTGIAGMATAWLLYKNYDITIFEKNDYTGGHSNTASIDYNGTPISVDTGFIVYNEPNYPHLTALFKHLNVETIKSDMSFGVSAHEGKIEYSGRNILGLFAQPQNMINIAFLKMLRDIGRFNKLAPKILNQDSNLSLGEFLEQLKLNTYFKQYYLLPMGGAIWSCPIETMLRYPAKTFIQFFKNHGLLTVNQQPQWHTVKGGSVEYVKKLTAPFKQKIRLNAEVTNIYRNGKQIAIHYGNQQSETFDAVILATHGDQANNLIKDKTTTEEKTLSAFKYQQNFAFLHKDQSFMPKRKKAWASWVYRASKTANNNTALSVTYWMNLLQSIPKKYPLFVTLNPENPPNTDDIFSSYIYEHPVYDQATIKAQQQLPTIQGTKNTWYCGSYHRYGFHEDALMSAVNVANMLGVKAPWQ